MAKRKHDPFSHAELHDPRLRAFSGETLREVSMPMGGIGTGCIGLGGRGQLRDWEIFGRPDYTFRPIYSLGMIHCRRGGKRVTRILESRLQAPFTSNSGLSTEVLSGMPRLADALFVGTYPFGRIEFIDDALPLKVSLEGFNPMIPGDAESSALPVAVLTYHLKNPTRQRVTGAVAWSMQNCVGRSANERDTPKGQPTGLGENVNRFRREKTCRGLEMTSGKYKPEHLGYGTMALMTPHADTTVATGWLEPGWWDRAQRIWDDFAADGKLAGPKDPTEPRDAHHPLVGTMTVGYDLAPGESTEITFVVAWCFPWRMPPAMYDGHEPVLTRNHYATRFADAWQAGRYAIENLADLRGRSRLFEQMMFDSTLPGHVLEAVSTQASILKTNTVMWLDEPADADEPGGRIYAFEGCHDTHGCCPMNCTHVWNYEQTLAHLYPNLERMMRRIDYGTNMHDGGAMAFRSPLPSLPVKQTWLHKLPAADGQFGTVVKFYRDWQLSGDRGFLDTHYAGVRDSIDFAQKGFAGWDADGDGVLEGQQHNTYDIDFHGPNTMTGALYLAALKAGIEMARTVGDAESEKRWQSLFAKGSARLEKLFQGGYYVQKVPNYRAGSRDGLSGQQFKPGRPKYQYGFGCLSDQLLGQWAAHVAGLGYVLKPANVRKAIRSVFRHNFRKSLADHESVQRTYALNAEAGLLLCTWPNGRREKFPFPYSDEVWTGIEYQVAAHLIYEGFVDEGLTIVKAIRERHDGYARNPFDEPECGHYYARALASWSVLLALSGQRFSAAEGSLTVRPVVNEDRFGVLVTLGQSWGFYNQALAGGKMKARLELAGGSAALQTLNLAWAGKKPAWAGKKPAGALTATVRHNRRKLSATVRTKGKQFTIALAEAVTLAAGETLNIQVACG